MVSSSAEGFGQNSFAGKELAQLPQRRKHFGKVKIFLESWATGFWRKSWRVGKGPIESWKFECSEAV